MRWIQIPLQSPLQSKITTNLSEAVVVTTETARVITVIEVTIIVTPTIATAEGDTRYEL